MKKSAWKQSVLAVALGLAIGLSVSTQEVGPARGKLVLVGGGVVAPEIFERFLRSSVMGDL